MYSYPRARLRYHAQIDAVVDIEWAHGVCTLCIPPVASRRGGGILGARAERCPSRRLPVAVDAAATAPWSEGSWGHIRRIIRASCNSAPEAALRQGQRSAHRFRRERP